MSDNNDQVTTDRSDREVSTVRLDSLLDEDGTLDPMKYVGTNDVAFGDLPPVYLNPIVESLPLSEMVLTNDGRVVDLETPTGMDGCLDPLGSNLPKDQRLDKAVAMLCYVDPWRRQGPDVGGDRAFLVREALQYGFGHGARTIGGALRLALEAKVADEDLVVPVLVMRRDSPRFAMLCGTDAPNGGSVREDVGHGDGA